MTFIMTMKTIKKLKNKKQSFLFADDDDDDNNNDDFLCCLFMDTRLVIIMLFMFLKGKLSFDDNECHCSQAVLTEVDQFLLLAM